MRAAMPSEMAVEKAFSTVAKRATGTESTTSSTGLRSSLETITRKSTWFRNPPHNACRWVSIPPM